MPDEDQLYGVSQLPRIRMRLIRRLSLLVLLAVLVAGSTSAQSLPPPTGSAKAIQLQTTDGISCSEPPYRQSVNVEVNLCVDRLVDADAQGIPGVRLDVTVLPENDPELLATTDENQFASRPQPAGATFWGPLSIRARGLATTPALSESASSSPAPLPAVTILPSTEIEDSPSLTFASASTLDRKLTRARLRTQEEAKLRRSRQLQRDLNEQCLQMHLSDLECSLKLKSQKLSAIGQAGQSARSQPPANH